GVGRAADAQGGAVVQGDLAALAEVLDAQAAVGQLLGAELVARHVDVLDHEAAGLAARAAAELDGARAVLELLPLLLVADGDTEHRRHPAGGRDGPGAPARPAPWVESTTSRGGGGTRKAAPPASSVRARLPGGRGPMKRGTAPLRLILCRNIWGEGVEAAVPGRIPACVMPPLRPESLVQPRPRRPRLRDHPPRASEALHERLSTRSPVAPAAGRRTALPGRGGPRRPPRGLR